MISIGMSQKNQKIMAYRVPYKAKINGSGAMQYLVIPMPTCLIEVYPKFNHSLMVVV